MEDQNQQEQGQSCLPWVPHNLAAEPRSPNNHAASAANAYNQPPYEAPYDTSNVKVALGPYSSSQPHDQPTASRQAPLYPQGLPTFSHPSSQHVSVSQTSNVPATSGPQSSNALHGEPATTYQTPAHVQGTLPASFHPPSQHESVLQGSSYAAYPNPLVSLALAPQVYQAVDSQHSPQALHFGQNFNFSFRSPQNASIEASGMPVQDRGLQSDVHQNPVQGAQGRYPRNHRNQAMQSPRSSSQTSSSTHRRQYGHQPIQLPRRHSRAPSLSTTPGGHYENQGNQVMQGPQSFPQTSFRAPESISRGSSSAVGGSTASSIQASRGHRDGSRPLMHPRVEAILSPNSRFSLEDKRKLLRIIAARKKEVDQTKESSQTADVQKGQSEAEKQGVCSMSPNSQEAPKRPPTSPPHKNDEASKIPFVELPQSINEMAPLNHHSSAMNSQSTPDGNILRVHQPLVDQPHPEDHGGMTKDHERSSVANHNETKDNKPKLLSLAANANRAPEDAAFDRIPTIGNTGPVLNTANFSTTGTRSAGQMSTRTNPSEWPLFDSPYSVNPPIPGQFHPGGRTISLRALEIEPTFAFQPLPFNREPEPVYGHPDDYVPGVDNFARIRRGVGLVTGPGSNVIGSNNFPVGVYNITKNPRRFQSLLNNTGITLQAAPETPNASVHDHGTLDRVRRDLGLFTDQGSNVKRSSNVSTMPTSDTTGNAHRLGSLPGNTGMTLQAGSNVPFPGFDTFTSARQDAGLATSPGSVVMRSSSYPNMPASDTTISDTTPSAHRFEGFLGNAGMTLQAGPNFPPPDSNLFTGARQDSGLVTIPSPNVMGFNSSPNMATGDTTISDMTPSPQRPRDLANDLGINTQAWPSAHNAKLVASVANMGPDYNISASQKAQQHEDQYFDIYHAVTGDLLREGTHRTADWTREVRTLPMMPPDNDFRDFCLTYGRLKRRIDQEMSEVKADQKRYESKKNMTPEEAEKGAVAEAAAYYLEDPEAAEEYAKTHLQFERDLRRAQEMIFGGDAVPELKRGLSNLIP